MEAARADGVGVELLGLIAMAEPYKFVIMNRWVIPLMSQALA
ncbi:hypothetical protein [Streptomyces sp. NRRL S-448]